jgi:AraC-like DNA-binding protein
MKSSVPVPVAIPAGGVRFAESIHTANFRMEERTDDFHKLVYVLRGSVTRSERSGKGQEVPTTGGPGSMFVVPAGTPHRFADETVATLMLLCLDPGRVSGNAESARIWAGLVSSRGRWLQLDRVAAQRLEWLWRRALLEQSNPRLGTATMVDALAAQSLVLLLRLPPLPSAGDAAARLDSVLREIGETFFEPWTLDRAATRAGVSRRRCSQLVRQKTGRSFGEFLLRLRLDHASRLLGSRDYSVLGVMFTCGFNEVSTFYRVFKRRFGRAPGQWRKR